MAKRIPAGMMRHQVLLQSYTSGLNAYGQATTTGSWTTSDTIRAAITPLRGDEATLARQVYPSAQYSVMIDYIKALDSTGATQRRISFGGRELHIGAILNPDEENWQHELLCGEEQ